jgi:hypothetical protein
VNTDLKEQLMDVTRLISDLRSERDDIERAILALERIDQLSNNRVPLAVYERGLLPGTWKTMLDT